MAQDPKAKMIIERYKTLKAQRVTWEDHWQDIADYFLPRKSNITIKRTKGDKRHDQIYDGTATHALELLSASLNGMLTNTISPWFILKFRNELINEDDAAVEWLESCSKVMQQVFARSNFQQEIFELYHELLAFGTSAMFITDDFKDDLRFKTIHISEIFITENERGMVDCLVRRFQVKNKNIPTWLAKENKPLYNFLLNKWYFDELYDFLFIKPSKLIGIFLWKNIDINTIDRFGPDGISNLIKKLSNKAVKFQSGHIYQYAFIMLLGFSAILTFLILN